MKLLNQDEIQSISGGLNPNQWGRVIGIGVKGFSSWIGINILDKAGIKTDTSFSKNILLTMIQCAFTFASMEAYNYVTGNVDCNDQKPHRVKDALDTIVSQK